MNTIRKIVSRARGRQHPRVPLPATDSEVELPKDVLAAIERASIHRRQCGESGRRRIVVQLNGSQGWYDSPDGTRKAIASRFPTLTEQQVEEAATLLRSAISAHVRVANRIERGPSWATNW